MTILENSRPLPAVSEAPGYKGNPLAAFDQTYRFTLDCGLRLVVLPRPGSPSVAFKFYVGSGSQFERPEQHGLSHFMEHCLFKSTLKRSGPAIYAAIENFGGQINAYTHREYLALSAQVQRDYWPPVLELLAEILSQPAFDPVLVAQEIKVVLEEIRRKDDKQSQIWDLLMKSIWGEDIFTRIILGTPETVSNFTSEDLREYHRARFTGPNTAVAVVGDVDPVAVAESLNAALQAYPPTPVFSYDPQALAVPPASPARGIKIRKNTILTTVLAGWPTITQYDRRRHNRLKVLNRILGVGGMGWLRQEMREKHHLAYSVQSLSATYATRGYLAAMFSVQPAQVDRAIEVLQEQISRLHDTSQLTEEALAINKASYEGSLAVFFDNNLKLAEHLGLNALMLVEDSFEATIAQIRSVRREDLTELAALYLNGQPYLALLGQ